jgi:hypothetical protein
MRKLPWAVLFVITGGAAINSAAGCGSETNPDIGTTDGGDEGTGADGNTNPPTNPPVNPPPDTDGSFIDAILDVNTRDGDAFACTLSGNACTTSGDCCTGNCIAADGGGGKICGNPIGACVPTGNACPADPTQCCLGACLGGLCGKCVDNNGACATSADCCGGGSCVPDGKGGGICQAVNCSPAPCTPACKTAGNSCTANSECCGSFCNGGICSGSISFCTQQGDVCSTDTQCCGGLCQKATGAAFGTCQTVAASGVGGCTPDGQRCGTGDGGTSCDMSCCSHSCGPFGAISGATICEPASGCKPTGDLCRSDDDCCGNPDSGLPLNGPEHCQKDSTTQVFGRCNTGTSCNEPGIICKAPDGTCNGVNNCCEPLFADGGAVPSSYCNNDPGNCCRKDALGIPRCLKIASDCTANPPPAGTACATSADCCGKPCVGGKCEGTCQQSGMECTTNGDCCAGLPCVIPPGSTKGICNGTLLPDGGVSDAAPPPPPDSGTPDSGNLPDGATCALYGQICAQSSDCCNAVPCTNGTCHFP